MRVYLMQHGKPIPKEENPERPLSVAGKKDVGRISEFLKRCGTKIDECVHSGKLRAKETAEIMVSGLNPEIKAKEMPGLAPLDDVQETVQYIKSRDRDIMIVGHLPHLAKLSSILVADRESNPVVKFQQGGIVCLERGEGGNWMIDWMLVPDLFGGSSNT